jgi:hypothetical protein
MIACAPRPTWARRGPPLQERNTLLQAAAASGAIANYEGWRRSLKGKRFKIKGVKLFNVTEITGGRSGLAGGAGTLGAAQPASWLQTHFVCLSTARPRRACAPPAPVLRLWACEHQGQAYGAPAGARPRATPLPNQQHLSPNPYYLAAR